MVGDHTHTTNSKKPLFLCLCLCLSVPLVALVPRCPGAFVAEKSREVRQVRQGGRGMVWEVWDGNGTVPYNAYSMGRYIIRRAVQPGMGILQLQALTANALEPWGRGGLGQPCSRCRADPHNRSRVERIRIMRYRKVWPGTWYVVRGTWYKYSPGPLLGLWKGKWKWEGPWASRGIEAQGEMW